MPFVNPNALAEMEALAKSPTLGNLHPDARRQAIARATLADFDAMRKRMDFLHSAAAVDADGYEWGVFRVKWENGRAVDVQRTRADHSDLDVAAAAAAGLSQGDYCAVSASALLALLAVVEAAKQIDTSLLNQMGAPAPFGQMRAALDALEKLP